MKVTMNTVNNCFLSADIHCSPVELLIIDLALRLVTENENVHEVDRRGAKDMQETLASFCRRKEE